MKRLIKLRDEILSEIDGGEECQGRDGQLSNWARTLEEVAEQLSTELSQLKGEAASMDIVVIENKAYMPWPKHMGIRGNLANRIGELETELSQLRAERAGLDEEALDNASTLAFYLFDQQGWDLSELSAEEITKRIIQRYLEIAKLTDSAPSNNGWQDISTAPRDGTKILAYLIDNAEHRKSFPENERNGIDIIVWTNHNKGGWISNRFGTPTHWMPLPDKLTDSSQEV